MNREFEETVRSKLWCFQGLPQRPPTISLVLHNTNEVDLSLSDTFTCRCLTRVEFVFPKFVVCCTTRASNDARIHSGVRFPTLTLLHTVNTPCATHATTARFPAGPLCTIPLGSRRDVLSGNQGPEAWPRICDNDYGLLGQAGRGNGGRRRD